MTTRGRKSHCQALGRAFRWAGGWVEHTTSPPAESPGRGGYQPLGTQPSGGHHLLGSSPPEAVTSRDLPGVVPPDTAHALHSAAFGGNVLYHQASVTSLYPTFFLRWTLTSDKTVQHSCPGPLTGLGRFSALRGTTTCCKAGGREGGGDLATPFSRSGLRPGTTTHSLPLSVTRSLHPCFPFPSLPCRPHLPISADKLVENQQWEVRVSWLASLSHRLLMVETPGPGPALVPRGAEMIEEGRSEPRPSTSSTWARGHLRPSVGRRGFSAPTSAHPTGACLKPRWEQGHPADTECSIACGKG